MADQIATNIVDIYPIVFLFERECIVDRVPSQDESLL